MRPLLTIATPAFNSADLIGETLESIRAQTFQDFKVVISIDGGDESTAQIARKFEADPRFTVIVHTDHKGWVGNLNWQYERAETKFFQYWQHDDIATPDYLEKLMMAMEQHPEAVITFSDLTRIGELDGAYHENSLEGLTPLSRVLTQIEKRGWIPFRGVTRSAALKKIGPLRSRAHNSVQEDIVWLAKAAREGTFIRVPEMLYYKRIHSRSLSRNWNKNHDQAMRRQVWLETGVGFLDAFWPLNDSPEIRLSAIGKLLCRLINPRLYRYYSIDPTHDAALKEFIRSFLDTARALSQIDLAQVFSRSELATIELLQNQAINELNHQPMSDR